MILKQDRMTSSQRLDALFRYQKLDRIPVGAMSTGFNTKNAGLTVADAYADPDKSFEAMQWTSEQYGWDPIPQYAGHTVLGAWDFGGDVRLPKGEYEGALMILSHPLQTEAAIETAILPDPKTAGRIPQAMAFSKLQAQNDLPVFFFSRSPFTMASNICGIEQFLRWTLKNPAPCHRLIKLAIDHIFNVLAYWVETFGADRIFAWMSSPCESNQLISPKIMEKYALPAHEIYHQKLRALGIRRFGFHVCGEQNRNLPLLSEASPWQHPSVMSFGHEVDIETAATFFPEDIIYGNVEPVVIQVGTPRQVYELSKKAIEKGRRAPGGFVLGPGCGLPVNAPPTNVYAMTKAVHDFGWYD